MRGWRAEDAAAHHALCADPRVVATLGNAPSLADSADVVARQAMLLDRYGYCFWAVEHRDTGGFIGWCGIKPGKAPIEEETEIGWTLAPEYWGRGLAWEAARATLAWAWANTDLDTIAAITTPDNVRSRWLMERLGMVRCPDRDFCHLDRARNDPLGAHLLYRIARPA